MHRHAQRTLAQPGHGPRGQYLVLGHQLRRQGPPPWTCMPEKPAALGHQLGACMAWACPPGPAPTLPGLTDLAMPRMPPALGSLPGTGTAAVLPSQASTWCWATSCAARAHRLGHARAWAASSAPARSQALGSLPLPPSRKTAQRLSCRPPWAAPAGRPIPEKTKDQ